MLSLNHGHLFRSLLHCVRPCPVDSFELVLVNPHENIVSVYGICADAPDGKLRIVMHRCVKSVWDLLQQHKPKVSAEQLLDDVWFRVLP